MSISNFKGILVSVCLLALSNQNAVAQDRGDLPVIAQTPSEQLLEGRRINRVVQPVEYWTEANSLNMRDNPVAGNIIGNLEYGQKILAYSQYENWVRISKPGAKEQWVKSDFLSNSRVSWASYNRSSAARTSDVLSVRIKDPDDRKNRIFGVRLKTSETENALITTRQTTDQGAFYQNRYVSCNNQKPVGIQLVGEGTNFLAAQNDVRNLKVDIYSTDQIDTKPINSAEEAIASFACKAQAF